MDAITLLKDDHKTVEKLFKRFEKAGERALSAALVEALRKRVIRWAYAWRVIACRATTAGPTTSRASSALTS